MDCRKVLARLHSYLDGEMPPKLIREFEEHLMACPSCRSQVEHIRRLGVTLDSLAVPPLPQEFAARIMVEARRKALVAKEKKSIFSPGWRPVQWVLDLPFSMRLAAFAMVFLACFLGVFMSRELSLSGNVQTVAGVESLEGLEWFSPAPPSSLGSAYVGLAWTTPEERDKP